MFLIQFKQGTTAYVLQGARMAAPVKGAVLWKEKKTAEQEVPTVEELRISLAGTPEQIESGMQACARWLGEAARVASLAGEEKVFLEVQVAAGGTVWRSPVLGGLCATLGAGPDQRAGQSQGLRLLVEREDFWEDSAEQALYLTSQATARQTGGVVLANHWDSGHANYAHLAAEDAGGDLPAPARVSLTAESAGQGTVFTGQNITADPANALLRLEGEEGTTSLPATLTTPSGAGYSNGLCARLSWSGNGSLLLLRLALPTALLQKLAGMPYLLLMKLGAKPLSTEKFWTAWRVAYNSGTNRDTLTSTRGAYLDVNREYQEGGVLFLPPWRVESGESPAALDLELVMQADATGEHLLDVDYVFLLPLEYWRIYREKAVWLSQLAVEDNPSTGTVKSFAAVQGHQAEGPGLWVWPNRAQRFYFLYEPHISAGTTVAQEMTLRMWHRPRKRTL